MRNTRPTLDELPPPPVEKTGWPWTEKSPKLGDTMPNGSPWPRISIVTPSYNQGKFIEETIRSVLLQGYPNLEYIVIDGGSTDHSVEVIRKYSPWFTDWVSEPDRGQAHAINKGFARCTGELLGWINSDDLLLPKAANLLATAFKRFPTAILAGDVINFHTSEGREQLLQQQNIIFDTIVEPWRHNIRWHQPGIYFPRFLYQQAGQLDESLHYAFDRDWLCRAIQIATVHYLHVPVAQFRLHPTSKTVQDGAANWFREESTITKRYWNKAKEFDLQLAQAALKMHQAATYLRVGNWARTTGLSHLRQAAQLDRRVCKSKFWLLCLKALMPLRVLRLARALHLRFCKKALWLTY